MPVTCLLDKIQHPAPNTRVSAGRTQSGPRLLRVSLSPSDCTVRRSTPPARGCTAFDTTVSTQYHAEVAPPTHFRYATHHAG
jgi:hypothetical protein